MPPILLASLQDAGRSSTPGSCTLSEPGESRIEAVLAHLRFAQSEVGCPEDSTRSISSRQNALAAALKEYGAIRRTIYAAKYLSDPVYQRKIARQLNRGESIHALRRQLHYARDGKITQRQPAQQSEQMWCLTVVTNAVICWHTEYLGLAVDQLRAAGREVHDDVLAHISPARSSAVNHYGSITVDYERELAQLDERGRQPLRTVTTDGIGAGL
ncbi:Tn3 family transposase [Streptomyces sp. ISL-94]|uniref:Tn3 family transposase n=1 Tax=Streptomyces sp. ISL-94 TaxID=2819190 RepID=UPI0025538E5B|nr:Tn3 family transposase [Streptomyces sp. ISL-94]